MKNLNQAEWQPHSYVTCCNRRGRDTTDHSCEILQCHFTQLSARPGLKGLLGECLPQQKLSIQNDLLLVA